MKFKNRYLVLILTCVVCFSFFGGVSAKNIKNKRITLNKKRVTLNVGKRVMLKLKGAKKSKVKWSCNEKKIAKVNKGVVKAKKTGKCTVVARYLGKKYKCVVTVTKHNSKFESKDIALSLKWYDNTCKSVVLSVFNNSDQEIKTGYGVALEKLTDGQWETVPFLETAPPVRAIIKKIKPHKEWTETIPINEYFGELTDGEYMLSKLVYANGKKVYPSIRFTVPSNVPATTSAPTSTPIVTPTP